jgi:hypothetical protein
MNPDKITDYIPDKKELDKLLRFYYKDPWIHGSTAFSLESLTPNGCYQVNSLRKNSFLSIAPSEEHPYVRGEFPQNQARGYPFLGTPPFHLRPDLRTVEATNSPR